jgi:predicted dehydrogenase
MDELVNGKVPYGCVRPEEALESHKLFTAALRSQQTRQAIEIEQ